MRTMLAISLTLGVLMSACIPTPTELSRADRKKVDSLFVLAKPELEKEADSLCLIWVDENINQYKDSLMDMRWAEIESILSSDEK